jgi:fatty-acyl-CoA synthase
LRPTTPVHPVHRHIEAPESSPSAADIIAHCRVHLAAYKVPRHVVFGEVPKTSTGKIQKFVLRERAKGM